MMHERTIKKILNRQKDTHKGMCGRILIVAGSKQFPGAAILASVAALRTGADIVELAAPTKVVDLAITHTPDIIACPLAGEVIMEKHVKQIIDAASRADVVLLGNGIGREKNTSKCIQKVLQHPVMRKMKKVVDADALYAIDLSEIDNAILTPHAKEYTAILKNSKCSEEQLQKNLGTNVILRKSACDSIFTKDAIYTNKTGNPGMARAGTGDILAGMCAALYARSDAVTAARAAAWLIGNLGDKLKKKQWYCYIASDVLAMLEKEKIKKKKIKNKI